MVWRSKIYKSKGFIRTIIIINLILIYSLNLFSQYNPENCCARGNAITENVEKVFCLLAHNKVHEAMTLYNNLWQSKKKKTPLLGRIYYSNFFLNQKKYKEAKLELLRATKLTEKYRDTQNKNDVDNLIVEGHRASKSEFKWFKDRCECIDSIIIYTSRKIDIQEPKKEITKVDRDGDTVPDDIDNCINIYNISQIDSDGDKIGDNCDNCPNLYNAKQEDSDNDGVGDKCQNPYSNNIKNRPIEKDEVYFDEIFFDNDSFEINKTEKLKLDKVIDFFNNKCADCKIFLDAYTTNSGTVEYNDFLSKMRAKRTEVYLKENGINNPDNLVVKHYGELSDTQNNERKVNISIRGTRKIIRP